MEPELAVAASVRGWPESLRRFLADHGGARVRLTAMAPDDLVGERFDVLVIDDLCSFLTPRLVADLSGSGRRVIGVHDAVGAPEGRIVLERCGIETVVGVDEGPEAVLAAVTAEPDREGVASPRPHARAGLLVIGGPRGGCGRTEVAITLASHLARSDGPTVLLDLDESHPSVARRLGLALHPNLATALDLHRHGEASPEQALQWTRRLGVLVGVRTGERRASWRHDVTGLVERLARTARWMVVDVGEDGLGALGPAFSAEADRLVAVGAPDPVGVARLVEWYAGLADPRPPAEVIVNRAPSAPFLRAEIVDEVTRSIRVSGFGFLPADGAVPAAAWDGVPVRRGPFHRTLLRWTARSLEGMAA